MASARIAGQIGSGTRSSIGRKGAAVAHTYSADDFDGSGSDESELDDDELEEVSDEVGSDAATQAFFLRAGLRATSAVISCSDSADLAFAVTRFFGLGFAIKSAASMRFADFHKRSRS
jgi:hypothetical protein